MRKLALLMQNHPFNIFPFPCFCGVEPSGGRKYGFMKIASRPQNPINILCEHAKNKFAIKN
jgi:hypothetical protein